MYKKKEFEKKGKKSSSKSKSFDPDKYSYDKPRKTFSKSRSDNSDNGSFSNRPKRDFSRDDSSKRNFSRDDNSRSFSRDGNVSRSRDGPRRDSSKPRFEGGRSKSFGDKPKRDFSRDDKPRRSFSRDDNSRSFSRDGPRRDFSRSDRPTRDSSKSFSKDKAKKAFARDNPKKDFSKLEQPLVNVSEGFNAVGKFPFVFSEKKRRIVNYFTQCDKNEKFFDEYVLKKDGKTFRQVAPDRSKLFAAIANGISQIGFKEDSVVLYLGASHGYTVSFLSDMLKNGFIFALDFAPRVVRDMVFISQKRENIAPMMNDANRPAEYKSQIPDEGVDVVFMDIAQKNQVEIFEKNCDMFLKEGGFGLLALKARSVDVTKKPRDIFKEVRAELEKKYVIVDYKELSPHEMDHALFVIKKS